MDIKTGLDAALKKQAALVERINGLAEERQQLLQEALRMEGEIRVLRSLGEEGK